MYFTQNYSEGLDWIEIHRDGFSPWRICYRYVISLFPSIFWTAAAQMKRTRNRQVWLHRRFWFLALRVSPASCLYFYNKNRLANLFCASPAFGAALERTGATAVLPSRPPALWFQRSRLLLPEEKRKERKKRYIRLKTRAKTQSLSAGRR